MRVSWEILLAAGTLVLYIPCMVECWMLWCCGITLGALLLQVLMYLWTVGCWYIIQCIYTFVFNYGGCYCCTRVWYAFMYCHFCKKYKFSTVMDLKSWNVLLFLLYRSLISTWISFLWRTICLSWNIRIVTPSHIMVSSSCDKCWHD